MKNGKCGTTAHGEHPPKKIPYRIAKSAARAAQYRAIYHHKEAYEVKAMCEFFGVSRAAYYAWVKKLGETDQDQDVWRKSRRSNEIHINLFIGSIEGKTLSKGAALINTTFD